MLSSQLNVSNSKRDKEAVVTLLVGCLGTDHVSKGGNSNQIMLSNPFVVSIQTRLKHVLSYKFETKSIRFPPSPFHFNEPVPSLFSLKAAPIGASRWPFQHSQNKGNQFES